MIKIGNALDVLKGMEAESVNSVITSPPFWGLRVYGTEPQIWGGDEKCAHEWHTHIEKAKHTDGGDKGSTLIGSTTSQANCQGTDTSSYTCIHCGAWRGELGSEPEPSMFISHLCDIFDEVKRVLRKDGVCWVNMSSTYISRRIESGSMIYKPKDDAGIPQKLYEAFRERGWYTRAFFTWWKQNPMPSSVRDRPSDSCEWIIMLTRSKSYWYDLDAERVAMSQATKKRDGHSFSGAFKGQFQGRPSEMRWQEGKPIENPKFYNEQGRNLRTGDFMQMSLDAEIEQARDYLAYLGEVKRKGGIITDDEGLPTGLFCNTKGFKQAHFATFPPRFAEIFINLSVPAKCCTVCGKGWKRLTKSHSVKQYELPKSDLRYRPRAKNQYVDKGIHGGEARGYLHVKTLGFRPDCSCDAPHTIVDKRCTTCNANDFLTSVEPCHKPGVVIDPFLGSGSTAIVAERLGRRWIGIELSEKYVEMARKRIEQESPLFTIPTKPEP